MISAIVPLVDGFEEIEATTIIDVLRRGGVEVVTAAIGDDLVVMGAHGMALNADFQLADVVDREFDAVVLPGGPGTSRLAECEMLMDLLRRYGEENRLLAAICAAPMVLCKAGVVPEEVQITCYPTCADELDRSCEDVPVVADGNIITGQSPGAAMLFALVVLQTLMGELVAGKVAAGLVTDVMEQR